MSREATYANHYPGWNGHCLLVYREGAHVGLVSAVQRNARRATRGSCIFAAGRSINSLDWARFCDSVLCRNYHTLKNLFHQGRPMPCELFTKASVSLS